MQSFSNIQIVADPESPLAELNKMLQRSGFNSALSGQNDDVQGKTLFIFDSYKTEITVLGAQLAEYLKTRPDSADFLILHAGDSLRPTSVALFQSTFVWPIDQELIYEKIFELVAPEKKVLSAETMVRVYIPDISRSKTAPFDIYVYLPKNNRFLLLKKKSEELQPEFFERFEKHRRYGIFGYRGELAEIYRWSASKMKTLLGDDQLPKWEKSRHARSAIREMLGDLTRQPGLGAEEMTKTLRRTDRFLDELSTSEIGKYRKIANDLLFQESNLVTHSRNTAAYCRMMALALGEKNIDDYYVGGLMHDIGMLDLPSEIVTRDPSRMKKSDLEVWMLHPGNGKLSVSHLKEALSKTVIDMIGLHHENPAGTGYPYGKSGDDVPLHVRVCSLADQLDDLTSVRAESKTYTLKEAFQELENRVKDNLLDAKVLQVLREVFGEEATADSESSNTDLKRSS